MNPRPQRIRPACSTRWGAITVALALTLAAACTHSEHRSAPKPADAPTGTAVPPKAALELAQRLLAAAVLPAGSRPASPSQAALLPTSVGMVATRNVADRHAVWAVPAPIDD